MIPIILMSLGSLGFVILTWALISELMRPLRRPRKPREPDNLNEHSL